MGLCNLVETALTQSNILQVMDGAYNGVKLSCINQAVISDKDNGLDKNSGYSVPLEIMPSGQFEPLYKTTLSVQVRFFFYSVDDFAAGLADIYHTFSFVFLCMCLVKGWRTASSSSICLWGCCYGP